MIMKRFIYDIKWNESIPDKMQGQLSDMWSASTLPQPITALSVSSEYHAHKYYI